MIRRRTPLRGADRYMEHLILLWRRLTPRTWGRGDPAIEPYLNSLTGEVALNDAELSWLIAHLNSHPGIVAGDATRERITDQLFAVRAQVRTHGRRMVGIEDGRGRERD